MKLCPLIFKPIFKPKIWGGRKLGALLGKVLPPGEPIGESWELADLETDQSVVVVGPAEGKTISRLAEEWGADLLGRAPLFEGRFPLLLKYLDAREHLSVQVHPDEAMAKRLGGSVRVKHEAWYVVAAEPEGCIYRGLVDGVDRDRFEKAIREGKVESLLKRIPVRAGHCYFLPSGTLHALGAGVLVAEIQTPSDVTYRVFDWNRIDEATGQPRELHVEQALECINFGSQYIEGEARSHLASVRTVVTRLITCNSFLVERVKMVEGMDQEIPYAELVIWMVLDGHGTITYDGGSEKQPFKRGDTVVLPAALEGARLVTQADCTWLEITVPDRPPSPPI